MALNQEIKERIFAAADELHAASPNGEFPNVEAVRQLSRAGMNNVVEAMKEWRAKQRKQVQAVREPLPAELHGVLQTAGQSLWETAQQLAKKAGLPFTEARLTSDAGYNATLGSAFLGQQLDRFNGSYILTFAGYNAGPRRAAQWMARYGDPRGKGLDAVVDWIERIPYTETRSYVQRVMENYEVYKMRLTGAYDIAGDLVNGRGQ